MVTDELGLGRDQFCDYITQLSQPFTGTDECFPPHKTVIMFYAVPPAIKDAYETKISYQTAEVV